MIATAEAQVTATLRLIMHVCDTRTSVLVEFFGPAHIVDARAARFVADRYTDADGVAAPRNRDWTKAPGSGFVIYTAHEDGCADDSIDLSDFPQVAALIRPEEGDCEHGLSAWLCVGPSHYPLDM